MNTKHYTVAALYVFSPLNQLDQMETQLRQLGAEHSDLCGTLIIAPEGLNGTIAGSRDAIDAVGDVLGAFVDREKMEYKESLSEDKPFRRFKIKQKDTIINIGVEVDLEKVGKHLDTEAWNALLSRPDVTVVDARNDYEYGIGSFKNAINPNMESFSEFPEFAEQLDKNKPVAMFCTGGIRCEKASAYMLENGFSEVYQLKGGILRYLEEVKEEESLWHGECFVFDERVAVSHGLQQGKHVLCRGCRQPVSEEDQSSPLYLEELCCPKCHDRFDGERKERLMERRKQSLLAQAKGARHVGMVVQKERLRKLQEKRKAGLKLPKHLRHLDQKMSRKDSAA